MGPSLSKPCQALNKLYTMQKTEIPGKAQFPSKIDLFCRSLIPINCKRFFIRFVFVFRRFLRLLFPSFWLHIHVLLLRHELRPLNESIAFWRDPHITFWRDRLLEVGLRAQYGTRHKVLVFSTTFYQARTSSSLSSFCFLSSFSSHSSFPASRLIPSGAASSLS